LETTLNDTLEQILSRFPKEKDQLIPILESVQESFGYLPKDAMEAISRYLRISEANIYGVASFYALFRFTPRGRKMIHVCRGTACHVKGGSRILDEVEKRVGIKAGETTPDMEYSLETISCFGSCALAPVMVINKEFHGRVTPEGVAQILGEDKK
jgi:NADH-quinone oxidoreductase subunit E